MDFQPMVWELDKLDFPGDGKFARTGQPRVVPCPYGNAMYFDGAQDSIVLETNPLIGLREFTVEVVFRPDAGGLAEQRFLHFGEVHADRLLFETRLTADGSWFLDTFICSGAANSTLFNKDFLHPVDQWYHLAATCDGKEHANFVNGEKEQSAPIDFAPLKTGRTSIGVRLNQVCWFRGAIHKIRITPRVLRPQEFIGL